MESDLNTVLSAALRLPPDQQKELIKRLSRTAGTDRKKTGDVRKYFGTFRSDDPHSGDNEKIDFDLAASYWDSHDPEN